MPPLRVFEVGERYGRLVVEARRAVAGTPVTCRCDCGNQVEVKANNLPSGNSSSCGRCVRRGDGNAKWRGGKASHPLYLIYNDMIARCSRPTHHAWDRYGGRGITVCQRWRDDFWTFVADVGDRPPDHSMDRRDNDGPYSPENVRWATPSQQSLNRRPFAHKLQRDATTGRFAEAVT